MAGARGADAVAAAVEVGAARDAVVAELALPGAALVEVEAGSGGLGLGDGLGDGSAENRDDKE